jgi:hypothetical protein
MRPEEHRYGCAVGTIEISSDYLGALQAAVVRHWGEDALTLPSIARLAAIGLVHSCWRDTQLEDWHTSKRPGCPTDYDMFRANIRLTRSLVPELEQSVVDPEHIRAIVTNPARLALPDLTAKAFCGPSWSQVVADAHGVVDTFASIRSQLGDHDARIVHAYLHLESRWWGTPGFDERLEKSLDANAPELSSAQRNGLIANPETMTEALFQRVICQQF